QIEVGVGEAQDAPQGALVLSRAGGVDPVVFVSAVAMDARVVAAIEIFRPGLITRKNKALHLYAKCARDADRGLHVSAEGTRVLSGFKTVVMGEGVRGNLLSGIGADQF